MFSDILKFFIEFFLGLFICSPFFILLLVFAINSYKYKKRLGLLDPDKSFWYNLWHLQ